MPNTVVTISIIMRKAMTRGKVEPSLENEELWKDGSETKVFNLCTDRTESMFHAH